ncbi:hypothetical protein SAMN04488563_1529 [Jiangella alkaliphila]|uniref:Uncharacterized protein n=1 Tax=Jiangella alkaliphila TaxID=419479 RepID=A0A1H2I9J1_9ACTN|nr:hypothetical protein SAMN04488563_1529 [Jiangella alkaliphila]
MLTVDDDATAAAERYQREAEDDAERLVNDPQLQQEWILQDNLVYGGLVGIGVVVLQPFLTVASLDVSAMICVVAWCVAIPLLAALLMVNRQETFRRRRTDSRLVTLARPLALFSALVGLVSAVWHIHWIAGVTILASAFLALGVHSAGFSRLEFGKLPGVRRR